MRRRRRGAGTTSKPTSPTTNEHRAAAAWQALGPKCRAPSAVDRVHKKSNGRCVYRLWHATQDGDPVIAKRYDAAVHGIERVFYQEVLPHLPVSTPRYYGELETDDGYAWIFLEDAGGQRFSPDDTEHRELAARWLGGMHAAGPDLPSHDRLPDRGPRHYRQHLDTGRRLILDNLNNPALGADGVALLRSVLSLCDVVERRWPELEEICSAAPSTLVHGDFRARNLFVLRAAGESERLLPVDWETAGWGVPAADLAPVRHHCVPQVDLDVYSTVVRERWPDFDTRVARRLMWVGLIFRRLAAIEWAALSLEYPRSEVLQSPLHKLRLYRDQVGLALEAESWRVRA